MENGAFFKKKRSSELEFDSLLLYRVGVSSR